MRPASTSSSVTRAPLSASAAAMASPRPLPAPVTIAPWPAMLNSSAHCTRVLLLQMARPSGNVDHDLHPLLTAQTLNPLLDHSVERNGLDPTLERVAAAGHLRDDRRKGVHGERHTGEVHFRHQEVEGRYDDRLVAERRQHPHTGAAGARHARAQSG